MARRRIRDLDKQEASCYDRIFLKSFRIAPYETEPEESDVTSAFPNQDGEVREIHWHLRDGRLYTEDWEAVADLLEAYNSALVLKAHPICMSTPSFWQRIRQWLDWPTVLFAAICLISATLTMFGIGIAVWWVVTR